jgi:hypothetical protein
MARPCTRIQRRDYWITRLRACEEIGGGQLL